MSTLDPQSPDLHRAISDRVESQRAEILRQAASDLEIEGHCRTLTNGTPTWGEAVEYLRTLALGEEGRDESRS